MTDSTKTRWQAIPEAVRKAIGWIDRYWKPVSALLAPILYYLLFHVWPWQAYIDIENKRNHVRFHDKMAHDLLKRGSYARAQQEYRQALTLDPTDYEGMNGSYLCDLFLELKSPSLEPAGGIGVQHRLEDLDFIKKEKDWFTEKKDGYRVIITKYLADLDLRIGEYERAGLRYDSVIAVDTNYLDALYTKGWLYYGTSRKDTMLTMFQRMTKADSFDFRGFHGYGYALYMRALEGGSRDTLGRAAEQSNAAMRLSTITRLNVVMDFGEIARADSPYIALAYHQRARRMLADSALAALPWNSAPLNVCLLTQRNLCLGLEDQPRKLAWIDYQLSLDYEALRRGFQARSASLDSASLDSLRQSRDSSQALLQQARVLEGDRKDVAFIYRDQLSILDRFLPDRGTASAGRPR